jgi:DNA-binding response OmpR family regulator
MSHVLIIDDDLTILNLFEQFLSSDGFSVSVAKDGREGLSLMKQRKPDLIITDIMMPEMDGLELIRKIRSHHPEIPVIAISGGMKGAQINFLPHARKFGACRVFEKPVSLSHLRTAVRELLGSAAQNS